jgi:hypothetical protein
LEVSACQYELFFSARERERWEKTSSTCIFPVEKVVTFNKTGDKTNEVIAVVEYKSELLSPHFQTAFN